MRCTRDTGHCKAQHDKIIVTFLSFVNQMGRIKKKERLRETERKGDRKRGRENGDAWSERKEKEIYNQGKIILIDYNNTSTARKKVNEINEMRHPKIWTFSFVLFRSSVSLKFHQIDQTDSFNFFVCLFAPVADWFVFNFEPQSRDTEPMASDRNKYKSSDNQIGENDWPGTETKWRSGRWNDE